jgi:hypothetical protein
MLKRVAVILLAPGVLLAAGCGPKAPSPSIHESMTQGIEPHAQTVWDISSRAYNDKGDGLDPSKISAADWAQLEDAGRQLRDRARVIAKDRNIVVAAPGETLMGQSAAPQGISKQTWDAANPTQIQALIDANPALFAQSARVLEEAGDTIVKAAQTKDVRSFYAVSSNLDEVCDGCHKPFWGTDEPPPVSR